MTDLVFWKQRNIQKKSCICCLSYINSKWWLIIFFPFFNKKIAHLEFICSSIALITNDDSQFIEFSYIYFTISEIERNIFIRGESATVDTSVSCIVYRATAWKSAKSVESGFSIRFELIKVATLTRTPDPDVLSTNLDIRRGPKFSSSEVVAS